MRKLLMKVALCALTTTADASIQHPFAPGTVLVCKITHTQKNISLRPSNQIRTEVVRVISNSEVTIDNHNTAIASYWDGFFDGDRLHWRNENLRITMRHNVLPKRNPGDKTTTIEWYQNQYTYTSMHFSQMWNGVWIEHGTCY